MQWPLVIGSAAIALWAIGTMVRIFDRQTEIQEHAENGQLRLLYGILRLMESSPPGLISTQLKLQLCRYISLAFTELQQKHGAAAGYQACIDTAEAQIEILEKRSEQQQLPRFEDAQRISTGQEVLPRYKRVIDQLLQLNVISEDDAKLFHHELNNRQHELEADTCLLRAERSQSLNDPMSAQRHYLSARLCLQQLKNAEVQAARIALVDQQLLALQAARNTRQAKPKAA
ncbi:MAG: hypothetical protein AB8B48_17085 [Pseudomonadales bacterium]